MLTLTFICQATLFLELAFRIEQQGSVSRLFCGCVTGAHSSGITRVGRGSPQHPGMGDTFEFWSFVKVSQGSS